MTSDELDDDGLRASYKEQGLFDNVAVDVRLKILPELEDEDGNMVPYARLSIDLTVDLTEGPDHWSIGWTNYLYYLQGDLKPYHDAEWWPIKSRWQQPLPRPSALSTKSKAPEPSTSGTADFSFIKIRRGGREPL